MLEEYPVDVENDLSVQALPACPVDFNPKNTLGDDVEHLVNQLTAEINSMASWFSLTQTTEKWEVSTGVSGLTQDQLVQFIGDFLRDKHGDRSIADLADKLRLVAEDLKAFYFKALSVRSELTTDPAALADWFWQTTCAAQIINTVRKKALSLEAGEMQLLGKLLLIPRNQLHRFDD